jgi:ArsR family transcriptional regulator, arsenate/arsenite/antimonite-responsive transcriptional repressor
MEAFVPQDVSPTHGKEPMATKRVQKVPLAAVACCTPVADPDITHRQADTLASIFKALADPHRVRIVNLLANAAEPVCVCDFLPQLGLSQGTVSFHLKKLLAVGLLDREERGTWAYYSLNRDGLDRLATVFDAKEAVT